MPSTHNTLNWHLSDPKSFAFGIDDSETHNGAPSTFLKAIVPRPKAFGFMSRTISAEPYLRKHLRISAWLKTALPERSSVQLWLRVDGFADRPGCFDNMFERRLKLTTPWTQHHVEVDVPPEAQQLTYGVLLNGPGQLWLSDLNLSI